MSTSGIRFLWPTWEWQVEASTAFFNGPRTGIDRFVWKVSRQIGKTSLLQALSIKITKERPEVYWYVAPSYDRCEVVYHEMCNALGDFIQRGLVTPRATKAGWVITFNRKITQPWVTPLGNRAHPPAELHLKSLGNPEHLRGATIQGLMGDEVGLWEEYMWDSILEPMLLVKKGWAIFCGTPPDPFKVPDPDFFPKLWEMGCTHPRWHAIERSYHAHPLEHVRDTIESKQAMMPADRFAREYLAEFTNQQQLKLPKYIPWGPGQAVHRIAPDNLAVATTIDLADNEREFGDKAAVITTGVGADNTLWILGTDYAKNPSEVLDLCYMHQAFYGSRWVGGQDSAFDRGFRYTVEQAELTRGPLNFIPLRIGGASKFRRILNGLEPLARMGKVLIHEDQRDLMNEWDQFPKGLLGDTRRDPSAHHFDMLDALACRGENLWRSPTYVPPEPQKLNTFRAASEAAKARARGMSVADIHDQIFRFGAT